MSFFVSKTESAAITAAEAAYAFHTVKHHESDRSMDCTSGLLGKVFTKILQQRKKSQALEQRQSIVNAVIAPHSAVVALEALQDIPNCGVSMDGSNYEAVKIFPLLIQYFDWKNENDGVQSKLLEIKNTPNESADTIAQYIKDTLEKEYFLNALHLLVTTAIWRNPA